MKKAFLAAFAFAAAIALPAMAQDKEPEKAGTCRQPDASTLVFSVPDDAVIALDQGDEWPRVAFYTSSECYEKYRQMSFGRKAPLRKVIFEFANAAGKDLPSYGGKDAPELDFNPGPDGKVFCMIDRFTPRQAEKTRQVGGVILKVR